MMAVSVILIYQYGKAESIRSKFVKKTRQRCTQIYVADLKMRSMLMILTELANLSFTGGPHT